MSMTNTTWRQGQQSKAARLGRASHLVGGSSGKVVKAEQTVALLESVIQPGDRVCLEGNNQKQADFLAQCLAKVNPQQVHDLHLLQSVVALPEHTALFDKGIAKEIDFSFSGPQGARLANLVAAGKIKINAIHTYLELFGRYFVDLTPNVALIAAEAAD
ncbi:MAG TPA: malonate decarboxylase subunit alpha, partial [Limnobacter sp.]|nr:malonate decarboxylase subunit alpha [Limnobacter sp.]